MKINTTDLLPVGYTYLTQYYKLKVIPHYRESYITQTGQTSNKHDGHTHTVIYQKRYTPNNPDDPFLQLEFAIKHEGINLEIINALFKNISSSLILQFIQNKPTGKYTRKIWFLYEFLTQTQLQIPDIKNVPYVDLLDSKNYYVASTIKSSRHAVNNNLLGTSSFCPMVRRTKILDNFERKNLSSVALKLVKSVDPSILTRTTNYLYTKETKSSFGIEKIKPDIKRTTRFIALLEEAHNIPNLNKSILLELQNSIVDDDYKDKDYRNTQNYVGELTHLYMQKIHYISPKPEDIHALMEAFLACENKLLEQDLSPVIIAAILSFAFVFLHPFEDGNGRIHRFIIHYVLSKTGFTPDNIIFPVSAVMLKNIRDYDQRLEEFSKPLLNVIENYSLNDQGELTVDQDSSHLYRYIDYTLFAEYLFDCIQTTIKEDFKDELDFIAKYDQTKNAIQNIVDMPDLKIDRIIRCVAQNNGVLGKKMRKTYFNELSEEKIKAIENVINSRMLNR